MPRHVTRTFNGDERISPGTLESPGSKERFAEMVARNRGIDIRAFTSEDGATRWLLAEEARGDKPSSPRAPKQPP